MTSFLWIFVKCLHQDLTGLVDIIAKLRFAFWKEKFNTLWEFSRIQKLRSVKNELHVQQQTIIVC